MDLAVIIQPEEGEMNKGINKQFVDIYPEIKQLNEEDEIENIKHIVQTKTEQRITTIYRANMANTESGTLIKTFAELARRIEETGRTKKIAVPRIQNVELYRQRQR